MSKKNEAIQFFQLAGQGKLRIGEIIEFDGKRLMVDKILEYHIGFDWAGNAGLFYKIKVVEV